MQLRGSLRGCTVPVQVSVLRTSLDMGELHVACDKGNPPCKLQLRGALRGCTVPVQVAALRKSLDMGGTAGPASQVITPIIDELAAEGTIQGRLQGGGTSWIPAAHTRRQQEAVTSFYQQNGFVG